VEGSSTTIYAGEALFAYVILRQAVADESSAIRFIDLRAQAEVSNALRADTRMLQA
jgi:hypothetical protein